MKHIKKLTRAQRKILKEYGYTDFSNIFYLTERKNSVVFVILGEDSRIMDEIEIDKVSYYKML